MCIVNVINDTWKHLEIFELKGIAILALKSELSSKKKKLWSQYMNISKCVGWKFICWITELEFNSVYFLDFEDLDL